MAEDANIVAFPAQKFTFSPAEIDIDRSIGLYDDRRAYALFALTLMTKPSADVRAILDRLGPKRLSHLLAAFEECAESFAALGQVVSCVHARLTAAKAKPV